MLYAHFLFPVSVIIIISTVHENPRPDFLPAGRLLVPAGLPTGHKAALSRLLVYIQVPAGKNRFFEASF
jgi:hypothetical protein